MRDLHKSMFTIYTPAIRFNVVASLDDSHDGVLNSSVHLGCEAGPGSMKYNDNKAIISHLVRI